MGTGADNCSGGTVKILSQIVLFSPAAAQLVGLGVHHGVHHLLGEAPEQLLHVGGAVAEPGHGEHVRCRF